jgi:hypothetical protein
MRRFVIASVVFVSGLAAGASTRFFVPAKQRVGVADPVAIMSVLQPDLEGTQNQADANVDAVWQRKINDTVFWLKLKDNLFAPLRDPDVERTGWYGSFKDDDARLRALEANLHAEQVPGCSFILVWFDAASPVEARLIANAVVRSHVTDAVNAARSALNEKIGDLFSALNSLARDEENTRSEIERTTDAMLRERRQSGLRDTVEQRRAMQTDLEKVKARLFEPDLGGVRVVRWGQKPRED